MNFSPYKSKPAASLLTAVYRSPKVLYIMTHAVFVIGKRLPENAFFCCEALFPSSDCFYFVARIFSGGPAKARAKESKTSLRLLLSAICSFLLISIISCCLVWGSRDYSWTQIDEGFWNAVHNSAVPQRCSAFQLPMSGGLVDTRHRMLEWEVLWNP